MEKTKEITKQDKYEAIKKLSDKDREEILAFALKRSEEFLSEEEDDS